MVRTTHNCELFHKKLNTSYNSSYPNVFHFINLRKGQYDTNINRRTKSKKKMTENRHFYA